MHPLFTFAADNPWLAFGLSWPLSMVLVSTSYLIAANIEGSLNLILRVANLATIWFRGYPPNGTPPIPTNVEPPEEQS